MADATGGGEGGTDGVAGGTSNVVVIELFMFLCCLLWFRFCAAACMTAVGSYGDFV